MLDCYIITDDRGRRQSFNRAAERMFGYEAKEVMNNNVSLLLTERFPGEHDELTAENIVLMDKQGSIMVSTSQVDDWAEVRVADTGARLPQDVQERVFDPFFTTKEVGKGTGRG